MYIDKLFNLKGKVVGVIGAGGHLCSEMAKSFARAGCKVVMIDLRIDKARKVEKEINDEGFKDTLSLALDVAHKNQHFKVCLLYTSPSPRDATLSRMPSSA